MDIGGLLPKHEPIIEPGETIAGRYLVEKEIARGGMAHILRAEDTFLNTIVALKVLPLALARNRHAVNEIKEEARITMALNHPNIVKLHQFENTPKHKFLVMEYVDGLSLEAVVDEKGKIPVEEALSYMRDACAALDYAHSEGVIHRDIKSGNFLVSSKGTVKLTDFGIAQKVHRAFAKITQKEIMGTVPYMSPEQLVGRKIDYRSDIYSLGAVLYELLSGFPPFFSGSIEAQIVLSAPKPVEGAPRHVNDAILKALSKSPSLRWQSATAFYRALTSEAPQEKAPPEPKLRWPGREIVPAAAKKRDFRILAVDDEQDVRTVVETILADEGYDVDTAFDGLDALQKLGEGSYDLLILDILMPRMDGIQLLSRIRNEGVNIPVIMLTALSDQKNMLESYRSGADYYMLKPFARDKLTSAVQYLLGDFSEAHRQDLERVL